MYSRRFGDRELHFEASGALWNAALVLRDRETDSWWSIMTSDAIGGPLDGQPLVELPVGEKTTWGDWRDRNPASLVLSVAGVEHEAIDPYANYFASDATFRDLQVEDDRLPPKAPVYTFHHQGVAYAVPHPAFEGGALFAVEGVARRLFLYRDVGASLFASTDAYWVETGAERSVEELVRRLRDQREELGTPLEGFDTFWYSWVGINRNSVLLGL